MYRADQIQRSKSEMVRTAFTVVPVANQVDISEPESNYFTLPCTTEDEEEEEDEQVAVTLDGCCVLRDQNGRHDATRR